MFLKCFYHFTVSTLTIEKRQPWDRAPYRILTCQKSKKISIRLLENRVLARREWFKDTESSHLIELRNLLRNCEKRMSHPPTSCQKRHWWPKPPIFSQTSHILIFYDNCTTFELMGAERSEGTSCAAACVPLSDLLGNDCVPNCHFQTTPPTLKMFFNR